MAILEPYDNCYPEFSIWTKYVREQPWASTFMIRTWQHWAVSTWTIHKRDLPNQSPHPARSYLHQSWASSMTKNDRRPLRCLLSQTCTHIITSRLDLKRHILQQHATLLTGASHSVCTWAGCDKVLRSSGIVKHVAISHCGIDKCQCECGVLLSRRDALARHIEESCSMLPYEYRKKRGEAGGDSK